MLKERASFGVFKLTAVRQQDFRVSAERCTVAVYALALLLFQLEHTLYKLRPPGHDMTRLSLLVPVSLVPHPRFLISQS